MSGFIGQTIFKRTSVLIIFLALLLVLPWPAQAAAWKKLRYEHFSQDEDLVTLLQDFSSSINVPLVASERVRSGIAERVNGHFKGLTAEGFLSKLAAIYQIVWYYDGHILYIYHSDEMITELFQLGGAKVDNLKRTLLRLGVLDSRFNWKMVEEENIIFISGPPRYIQLVREISSMLDRKFVEDEIYTVRIFPLRYASAGNRNLVHRGERIEVPGVAQTLGKILGQGTKISFDDSAQLRSDKDADAQSGLKGKGLRSAQGMVAKKEQKASRSREAEDRNRHKGAASTIEANVANNTIIVHDLLERMPMYSKLIASLDKPSPQIEIEVSIVDVNTARMNELGVDWRLRDKNGTFGVGSFGGNEGLAGAVEGIGSRPGAGSFLTPDFGNLTTILANNGNYFLGRVRMLSEDGEGQVLSQPSVITMNNQEAVIESRSTFYVRLEGENEVDLIPIDSGSIVNVTPRVIYEGAVRKISMNVSISDGQTITQGGNTVEVDDIPTVSTSSVTTQAVIEENNSLLIGGFFVDTRLSEEKKVPVLGDIPGLGFLFKNSNKERRKAARMFMITPKIIDDSQYLYEATAPIKKTLDSSSNFTVPEYRRPDFFIFE